MKVERVVKLADSYIAITNEGFHKMNINTCFLYKYTKKNSKTSKNYNFVKKLQNNEKSATQIAYEPILRGGYVI